MVFTPRLDVFCRSLCILSLSSRFVGSSTYSTEMNTATSPEDDKWDAKLLGARIAVVVLIVAALIAIVAGVAILIIRIRRQRKRRSQDRKNRSRDVEGPTNEQNGQVLSSTDHPVLPASSPDDGGYTNMDGIRFKSRTTASDLDNQPSTPGRNIIVSSGHNLIPSQPSKTTGDNYTEVDILEDGGQPSVGILYNKIQKTRNKPGQITLENDGQPSVSAQYSKVQKTRNKLGQFTLEDDGQPGVSVQYSKVQKIRNNAAQYTDNGVGRVALAVDDKIKIPNTDKQKDGNYDTVNPAVPDKKWEMISGPDRLVTKAESSQESQISDEYNTLDFEAARKASKKPDKREITNTAYDHVQIDPENPHSKANVGKKNMAADSVYSFVKKI